MGTFKQIKGEFDAWSLFSRDVDAASAPGNDMWP